MTPLMEIRHDHLGASYVLVTCEDKDCHSKHIGEKILHLTHNGYGDKVPEVTTKQREDADKVVEEHNQNHKMRMLIGHHDAPLVNGVSKVVYEKKS